MFLKISTTCSKEYRHTYFRFVMSSIVYFRTKNISSISKLNKFIFANKNTKKYMKELKLKIQSDLTKKYCISLQLLLMLTKI